VTQAKTLRVSPSAELLWIQQGWEADKVSIQTWDWALFPSPTVQTYMENLLTILLLL